ncbi:MAG TPA: hypothetical protein VFT02_15545, partial [Pyrinomonadaceae bacterium]|nr:hypothetical protein [Pyrinomonadaceae bacterium]
MKRRLAIFPIILLLAVSAFAQAELLTVDSIFTYRTRSLGPVRWIEEASGYVALEPSPTKRNFVDIVHYEPVSGKRTVLVAAEQLIPPGASEPLLVEDF